MQVQAARAVLASDPARADAVLAKAQQQSTEALAEETSAAGVPTDLAVTGPVRALAVDVEESLFRAAQEALTNVRKHAAAGSARLGLAYGEDGTVRLEVHDDGRGTTTQHGTGFRAARPARAGLDVVSEPGRGTVRVAVPG